MGTNSYPNFIAKYRNDEDFRKRECARQNVWRRKHAERLKPILAARSRLYRRKLRQDVMTAYGASCACCGETANEFLTIDHINGNGVADRGPRAGHHFYQWLRTNGFPNKEGLRVLCWNCNCAIGVRGYCPHDLDRAAKGGPQNQKEDSPRQIRNLPS